MASWKPLPRTPSIRSFGIRQSSKISSQVEEHGCPSYPQPCRRRSRIGALNDEGRAQLGGTALLIQNAVGDSDDDKDISETGVGDEDLGAIQDPAVILFLGNGLLTLCIGTSTRLGQAESAQPLAAAQLAGTLPSARGCRSHK